MVMGLYDGRCWAWAYSKCRDMLVHCLISPINWLTVRSLDWAFRLQVDFNICSESGIKEGVMWLVNGGLGNLVKAQEFVQQCMW